MHILMVAAENGALPGGKVGGIGDVIRDVPRALSRAGHKVSVITPGYQALSKLPGAKLENSLTVEFCSSLERVELFRITPQDPDDQVEHWVVEYPLFAACGKGNIYCNDQWEPFATDAHKFALFCNSVCHAIITGAIARPDVIHLHDWHATPVLFLRAYRYSDLQKIPTVYTVHNLSIQGVRPFRNNDSSLESWFSITDYDSDPIRDPVSADCVNLMRMGINMADKVHVVSPNYAREIRKPSNTETGYVGGEGLENDINQIHRHKKLFGILNGCEYPDRPVKKPSKQQFIRLANKCLLDWVGDETYISTAYFFAQQRLMSWSSQRKKNQFVVASIGRLTNQKVSLLEYAMKPGVSNLELILDELGDNMLIMLGTGDQDLENFMSRIMARRKNFIFLRGYSDTLSEALYQICDLFLMPSSFEPCGISQMLAMRAGKPCLVHHVGGLADTVKDGKNGFSFDGKTLQSQSAHMLKALQKALWVHRENPGLWTQMCKAAAESRFTWDKSIRQYIETLYGQP